MLIEVALPLSLAFIMFSLGYGLTPADFGRVFSMPKAVLAGIFLQVIAVPVVAQSPHARTEAKTHRNAKAETTSAKFHQ